MKLFSRVFTLTLNIICLNARPDPDSIRLTPGHGPDSCLVNLREYYSGTGRIARFPVPQNQFYAGRVDRDYS